MRSESVPGVQYCVPGIILGEKHGKEESKIKLGKKA